MKKHVHYDMRSTTLEEVIDDVTKENLDKFKKDMRDAGHTPTEIAQALAVWREISADWEPIWEEREPQPGGKIVTKH